MKKAIILAVIAGLFTGVANAKELTTSEKDAAIAVPTIVVTSPLWMTALRNKHDYGTFLTRDGTLFKAYYGQDAKPVTKMDYYKNGISQVYKQTYGVKQYLDPINGNDIVPNLKIGDVIVKSPDFKHSFIYIVDKITTDNIHVTKLHASTIKDNNPNTYARRADIMAKYSSSITPNEKFGHYSETLTLKKDELTASIRSKDYYTLHSSEITAKDILSASSDFIVKPYHQVFFNCKTYVYETLKKANMIAEQRTINNLSAEEQEFQEELEREKSQRLVEEQENANVSDGVNIDTSNNPLVENEEMAPNSNLNLENVAKNNIEENKAVEGGDDINDPDKVGGKDGEIFEDFAE